jgi:hypothetical protein
VVPKPGFPKILPLLQEIHSTFPSMFPLSHSDTGPVGLVATHLTQCMILYKPLSIWKEAYLFFHCMQAKVTGVVRANTVSPDTGGPMCRSQSEDRISWLRIFVSVYFSEKISSKINLSICLTKHYTMKAYGGVEV